MGAFRRRDERGATAVEFALVSIPLFVLVFAMIDYGWYFFVSQTSGSAASNVARRLQVGDCWAGTEAFDLAKKQSFTVTSVNKTPTDLTSAVVGTTQIKVDVSADGKLIGFVPLPDGGQIAKTVYAQLEDETSSGSC